MRGPSPNVVVVCITVLVVASIAATLAAYAVTSSAAATAMVGIVGGFVTTTITGLFAFLKAQQATDTAAATHQTVIDKLQGP